MAVVITITDYDLSAAIYDLFEAKFAITGSEYSNPFYPYDADCPAPIIDGAGITVDASFVQGETTIVIPCFYTHDYIRSGNSTTEYATPSGSGYWMVRWSPSASGLWEMTISATDASGTVSSEPVTFTATSASGHGFVKASATDVKWFELSDGTPVHFTGLTDSFTNTYDADTMLETYGENKINLVRYWMSYRGWQCPWGGGDIGTTGNAWGFTIDTIDKGGGCKVGDLFSIKLSNGQDIYQSIYLTAGETYRFSGYCKTSSIGADAGEGLIPFIGTTNGTPVTGTHDWAEFYVEHTAASSGAVNVGVRHNANNGDGYVDDMQFRKVISEGVYSSTYLKKGDIDYHNYIDLIEASKVDYILAKAKTEGVYLKICIAEKQDLLGYIDVAGGTEARADANFYGTADHPTRWLHQAYWRYLTARWGAYTSVHSWELCNEGDPFSSAHYDIANAFATYIHTFDDNDRLCTTTNWHSIPMGFWQTATLDYIDVHEYVGPYVADTGSHGARFYAWIDPRAGDHSTDTVPYSDTYGSFALDTAEKHSGSQSLKIVSHDMSVGGSSEYNYIASEYVELHVGVLPGRAYTLSYWAKGVGVVNKTSWMRPELNYCGSAAFHENDYVAGSGGVLRADLGTYDWKKFTGTVTPAAGMYTLNIAFRGCRGDAGEGDSTIWFDDVSLIDTVTGEELITDGGFEGARIDYDTGLMAKRYGSFLNQYGLSKQTPAILGETGIRDAVEGENDELADDTTGIHIRKLIWGSIGIKPLHFMYWWTTNIETNNLHHLYKHYQDFIEGLSLSGGTYVDAAATCSVATMKAQGAKDTTNNKAHLWVDNIAYNWKNAVDETLPEPIDGNVVLTGLADDTYTVEVWNTSTGEYTSTQIDSEDSSMTIPLTGLVSDAGIKVYKYVPSTDNVNSLIRNLTRSMTRSIIRFMNSILSV